jgi:hypothetical protein
MENESPPQNYEQFNKSNVDNRNLPAIKYPHLTLLNLLDAHNDYIEHNNLHLVIDYDSLQTVIYNFTRNTTRINSSKVNKLSVYEKLVAKEHLNDYFPHAENIR